MISVVSTMTSSLSVQQEPLSLHVLAGPTKKNLYAFEFHISVVIRALVVRHIIYICTHTHSLTSHTPQLNSDLNDAQTRSSDSISRHPRIHIRLPMSGSKDISRIHTSFARKARSTGKLSLCISQSGQLR